MRFLFAGVMIMTISAVSSGRTAATFAADKKPVDKARTAEKNQSAAQEQAADDKSVPAIDPERAFGYLARICDIGPRLSGSAGMERQQELIKDHFTKLKAQVKFQSFDAPHPQTRTPVRMNNMIVSWDPAATLMYRWEPDPELGL